jgi:hypothetical protein
VVQGVVGGRVEPVVEYGAVEHVAVLIVSDAGQGWIEADFDAFPALLAAAGSLLNRPSYASHGYADIAAFPLLPAN